MKRFFATTILVAAATTSALAADIGISVEISEPGVYGRIDIGRFPQPRVVLPQPVIIAPPPRIVVAPEPIYMWVPYGHRKDWRKHCARYNACGVPVYFVRHDWYDREVRGHRDRGRDDDQGRGKGKSQGKGHGKGRD